MTLKPASGPLSEIPSRFPDPSLVPHAEALNEERLKALKDVHQVSREIHARFGRAIREAREAYDKLLDDIQEVCDREHAEDEPRLEAAEAPWTARFDELDRQLEALCSAAGVSAGVEEAQSLCLCSVTGLAVLEDDPVWETADYKALIAAFPPMEWERATEAPASAESGHSVTEAVPAGAPA